MYDYNNAANGTPTSSPGSPESLNAIQFQPAQTGLSLDLLTSLQGLQLGGM